MATMRVIPAIPRHDEDHQVERHWRNSLPMEFRRGDYLYLPGDHARSVFLLRSGWVRIGRLLDSGGDLTLDLAGAGELIGEAALFGERQRIGLAQALSDVVAIPAPVSVLQTGLRTSPALALVVSETVWRRSRRVEERAVDQAYADCAERLRHVLLEVAERFGVDEPDGRRIAVRLTHEDLARMIGAARETVTPLLVEMRRTGAIHYDRSRFIIRDRAALGRTA